MSSITTPDPDDTPQSGYRTAESRPGAPDAPDPDPLLDPYAKYVTDLAYEHIRTTKVPRTPDDLILLLLTAYRAGYVLGREIGEQP